MSKTFVELAQVFCLKSLVRARLLLQKIDTLIEDLIRPLMVKFAPKVLALKMIVLAPKEKSTFFAQSLQRFTVFCENGSCFSQAPIDLCELADFHPQPCKYNE